jgi:MoaD family protein
MIKVTIKFFAGIKNQVGVDTKEINLKDDTITLDVLIKKIISILGPKAKNAFFTKDDSSYKFIAFINGKIITDTKNTIINNGDNVYFMPPVSGG